MKHLIVLTLMLFVTTAHAQTDEELDAFTIEMCKTLAETKGADSTRVYYTFDKHFPAFLEKHKIASEEAFKALYDRIYFRFQKNCMLFRDMLDNGAESRGDWKKLDSKPNGKLPKKACRELTSIKNFYYLEGDGASTNVTIDNGYWTERFEDGTYSKLYFRWTGDCEFEIEFIESNNLGRKNFSSKGDIYKYGIYGSDDKGYDIWTEEEQTGDKLYLSFRLYPKK